MEQLIKSNIFEGPVDGTKKLPSIRRHKALPSQAWLVGYKDKPGCFSFQPKGPWVEVTLYPSVVPNSKEIVFDSDDAVVVLLEHHNGWGFRAIHQLISLINN